MKNTEDIHASHVRDQRNSRELILESKAFPYYEGIFHAEF